MKILSTPLAVAALALLSALLAHPSVALARFGEAGLVAASVLAILLVLSEGFNALSQWRRGDAALPATLLAAGSAVVLAACAYDGLRGHEGAIVLRRGAGSRSFEERGPGGARLGLRPLGFDLTLESLNPESAMLRTSDGGTATSILRPDQALSLGQFRVSWGEYQPSARLVIGLSRPEQSLTVEVGPDSPASAAGLEIAVERYFPDLAFDAANEPYSRSREPRNPAALLNVRRGSQVHRVFVLRSVPGIHSVPELGFSFSLNAIDPDDALLLHVHQEPAARVMAAGVVLALLGLVLGVRR